MAQRFEGTTAVVTGAAAGIGRATAARLLAEGARVVAIDVDESGLAALAEQAERDGTDARVRVADCTSEEAVSEAFGFVRDEIGTPDVLVNNVGGSAREQASEFWESQPATWEKVIRRSLVSVLLCSHEVVPAMRERGSGCIVNLGSDAAMAGDPGFADYSASKLGVVGFTRVLAKELAPFGVRVNAVCPGAIATQAHDRLPSEVIDRIRDAVPMGTVGRPEQVAAAIAFLASSDADYVTGQSLLVNGGRWMV